MAYKQKGCTPITAKIQKTTKGGVTNPLLKGMGVPMKTSSPAKFTNPFGPDGFFKKNSTSLAAAALGPNAGAQVASKIASYFTTPSNNANKTKSEETKPTKETKPVEETKPVKETSTSSGKITGKIGSDLRKAQYDKKGWKYDDTIKGYDKSGNKIKARAAKPKVKAVSNIEASKPKVEKTAEIKMPAKAKTKKEVRVENRTNRQTARKESRANRKATREENRANRKAARNGSPAKQTMQQQNRIDRKAPRKAILEARADRRVAPKEVTKTLAKPKESGKSPAKNYKKGYYGK